MAAEPGAGDVTRLLGAVRRGEPQAQEQLVSAVHDELRRTARGLLARERPGATLQPTLLVNEAWVSLFGAGLDGYENRRHLFGAAAEAMRRWLVQRARRARAQKRGGGRAPVTLGDLAIEHESAHLDLIALDEALSALRAEDERLFEIARLRYFAGLTVEETAAALEVSRATVKRDWAFARVWLLDRIEGS